MPHPNIFTTLISVADLQVQYENCIVVDCRFSLADETWGEQVYLQNHLPQARYAHLNSQLSSPINAASGRHPLPDFIQLAKQLGNWGIDNQTQVVVYDDIGGGFAARLWWLLRAMGHKKAALLDGGLQAWQAAGLSLESTLPNISAAVFKPTLNCKAWLTSDQITENLSSKNYLLIDARDEPRFHGELEPIDPIAGHIPGSINLPVASNLSAQGKFLDAKTLQARYLNKTGQRASEKIVHSCGSGVFACLGVLAMEIAGLEGSKIYAGSWSEWIRDPARPIATI